MLGVDWPTKDRRGCAVTPCGNGSGRAEPGDDRRLSHGARSRDRLDTGGPDRRSDRERHRPPWQDRLRPMRTGTSSSSDGPGCRGTGDDRGASPGAPARALLEMDGPTDELAPDCVRRSHLETLRWVHRLGRWTPVIRRRCSTLSHRRIGPQESGACTWPPKPEWCEDDPDPTEAPSARSRSRAKRLGGENFPMPSTGSRRTRAKGPDPARTSRAAGDPVASRSSSAVGSAAGASAQPPPVVS